MPATLNGILENPASLTDLVDYADSVPVNDLFETAAFLSGEMCDDDADPRCRRTAFLLNAVVNRLVFEKYGVPKRGEAVL